MMEDIVLAEILMLNSNERKGLAPDFMQSGNNAITSWRYMNCGEEDLVVYSPWENVKILINDTTIWAIGEEKDIKAWCFAATKEYN